MGNLLAAALTFLGIHLLVSGTELRDAITVRIGEKPYLGLFALSSLTAIVWLCNGYNHVSLTNTVLFDLGSTARLAAIPATLCAFILIVPGVMRTNPTSQGQEKAAIDGVLRLTRHPFLWGVMLWSGSHLLAKGTLEGAIFFGTFFLVAAFGTRAIDGKVKRKRPEDWKVISAVTSNIPFAAIIAGKTRFSAKEYFDLRFLAALVIFAVVAYFHTRMFSSPAYPPSWF